MQKVIYPLSSGGFEVTVGRVYLWRHHHSGHDCISSGHSYSNHFVEAVLTRIFTFFITSLHAPNNLHCITHITHSSELYTKKSNTQIKKHVFAKTHFRNFKKHVLTHHVGPLLLNPSTIVMYLHKMVYAYRKHGDHLVCFA